MTTPLAHRAVAARALLALTAVTHALLVARHLLALGSLHALALDVVPNGWSSVGLLDGALTGLSWAATALTLACAVALAGWSASLARAAADAGLAGWAIPSRAFAASWLVPGANLIYPFYRLLALRRSLDATPLAAPVPVARDDAGYRDPARALPPPAAPPAAPPIARWAALWLAAVALPLVASCARINPRCEEGVRVATLFAGAIDALRVLAAVAGLAVVGRLTAAVGARLRSPPAPPR